MKISNKVPAEIIPVTFDFSEILPSIDSIVQVGVNVMTGTDAGSAAMLLGSPSLAGTSVVQIVRNGLDGVTYRLYCLVAHGGERYQIDGDMTVKTWHTS